MSSADSRRICRAYTATEIALVEWVDGNPYSRAAEPDIVIRWRGGESGRGRHSRSLMIPLDITPRARRCTILQPRQSLQSVQPVLSTYARPNVVYPHQNSIGSMTMKNVCVPRFAVNAKYESSAGVRSFSWSRASGSVSERRIGMSHCRSLYLHLGSFAASVYCD